MANVTPPKNDDWFIRNAIYCWLNYFGEEHQWRQVHRTRTTRVVPTKPRPAKRRKTTNATPKPQLKEWEFKTTDGQVRYLLAPDLEHAAWAAAELSGGTQFLKDVRLCDEW